MVNALLDDGSTITHLNRYAAVGLQEETKQVKVNVLNNQSYTFEAMPVDIGLGSLDVRIDTKISAFTGNKLA